MTGRRPVPYVITLVSSSLLFLLVFAPSSAAEGLPTVEFVSDGGLIWGDHELLVTVSGDLDPGEVYYFVDGGTEAKMEDLLNGTFRATIDVTKLTEGPHSISVTAYNTTGESTTVTQDVDVDFNSPQVDLTSSGGHVRGDVLVIGTAVDPYLNESAVYCVVDDDLEASRSNVMTRVDDHFEFLLDTTTLADGFHDVRMWAYDLWGSWNKSDGTGMDVDNTVPVVTLQVGSDLAGGDTSTYTFQAQVLDDRPDEDRIWAVIDGDVDNATDHPMRSAGAFWEVEIDTTKLSDGTHSVVALVFDKAGNNVTSASMTLEVDNTPPGVELLSGTGVQTGLYTVVVRATDSHMGGVVLTVRDRTPVDMVGAGEDWSYVLDTAAFMEGEIEIQILATDVLGNPTTYTFKIVAANRPNLSVVNVTWSGTRFDEGDKVKATVTVLNDGAVGVSGFVVAIMGNGVLASINVSDTLAANSTGEYVVTWKAEGGDYRLTVKVDPKDSVKETDESDNEWDQRSEVKVEGGLPGPGAALVVLGLVAVAVARARWR